MEDSWPFGWLLAASNFRCKFQALVIGRLLLRRKAMVVKRGVAAEGAQRVWWAPLNQTSGLQGRSCGGWVLGWRRSH